MRAIHELDKDDTLRVDAQGPNFLFHINDQLVGKPPIRIIPVEKLGFMSNPLMSPMSTSISINSSFEISPWI